jgi:hypothetical protein
VTALRAHAIDGVPFDDMKASSCTTSKIRDRSLRRRLVKRGAAAPSAPTRRI